MSNHGSTIALDSTTISILFDLDGTLCDPREGIVRCVQYALRKLGVVEPAEDQLTGYIGPPLYETFAALLGLRMSN